MIQKTFKMTHHQVLWQESWPNLLMKMKDMPYYKYKPAKSDKGKRTVKEEASEGRPGDIEVLQKKFAKYIKK